MAFTVEIKRIIAGVLLGFSLIGASATYWAIVGADTILARSDNPRLVEREARIQRGAIYDREGVLLAETVPLSRRSTQRIYHEASTYSALGYYSLRYGVGGLEALFDTTLQGEDVAKTFERFFTESILHQAPQGSDIRLTLDIDLQAALFDAMSGYDGAVVVMRARDGAMVGLISQPSIDPNALDGIWGDLVEDERKPFFNRATQGQYQAGGILQTPLMLVAILAGYPLDTVIEDGSRAVLLDDDVEMGCAIVPAEENMTFLEAYAYGCPYPHHILIGSLAPQTLSNTMVSFGLDRAGGFVETIRALSNTEGDETSDDGFSVELSSSDLLGQGILTANPIAVTMMSSSLLNMGNSPYPYILEGVRQADEATWLSMNNPYGSRAFMTEDAARRLRERWIEHPETVPELGVLMRPDGRVGVHVAVSKAGESDIAWLTGFVLPDEGDAYAFTITLENRPMMDIIAIADILIDRLMAF